MFVDGISNYKRVGGGEGELRYGKKERQTLMQGEGGASDYTTRLRRRNDGAIPPLLNSAALQSNVQTTDRSD